MAINHVSIEDAPLNGFHERLTFRAGGGTFVDGYVFGIFGVALLQVSTALSFSSFWEGVIAASVLIGIFFGGFLGGWLTNRFGRKRIFLVAPVVFMFASLAHYWVDSATTLFALRLLIGVGVGIEYPVSTALLVEFLPRQSRGPRLATLAVLWFVGAAVSYIVGELILRSGLEEAWRLALASGGVLGGWLLIVRLGTLESPRWLLSKERFAEAEDIIKTVYGSTFTLSDLPEQKEIRKLSFRDLLHSGYGRRMLFVVLFWTCSVIPIFAVYSFAPKVLAALGLTGDFGSIGSVLITIFFCCWL